MSPAEANPPPVARTDTVWWRRLLAARWLVLGGWCLGAAVAALTAGLYERTRPGPDASAATSP